MIRIIIADDQRLLRESFKKIIETNSDIEVVACAANGREAFEFCKELEPDIILLDILMPICGGIEAIKLIKPEFPNVKILVLTASSRANDVAEALNEGADGYILKDIGTEELILSIKSISLGLGIIHKDLFKSASFKGSNQENTEGRIITVKGIGIPLTERELKIIEMVVGGKDNKEIANTIFLAEGTVKNVITEIISKLELRDRTQLAVFAIRNQLV